MPGRQMQTCPRRKLVVTTFFTSNCTVKPNNHLSFCFQTGFDIFGMIDLCLSSFGWSHCTWKTQRPSLSASQANPSSREVMLANSVSTSSLGQAFSPSTRIPIPNMIPAMQIKYPVTFHHASLSISCSTTRALKEFERMLKPWKIVTIKSASYCCMAFCHVWHIGRRRKKLHQLKSAIKSSGAMHCIHDFSGSHPQTQPQLLYTPHVPW